MEYLNSTESCHCVKSVRIRSFSGLYFPVFGLNQLMSKIKVYIPKILKISWSTLQSIAFKKLFTMIITLVQSQETALEYVMMTKPLNWVWALGSHWRCSLKKAVLKILQNSQENTCAVVFLTKFQAFSPPTFRTF